MNVNIIDQCDTGDMKNAMKSVRKVRCIMKMFLIKPLITLSSLENMWYINQTYMKSSAQPMFLNIFSFSGSHERNILLT